MANTERWGITDGMKLASTVGRFLADKSQYTTAQFIAAAESAAKAYPNEWVVFYSVGGKYLEVGQFGRALEACKRSVELKPTDLRSTYALATIYNALTTADLASRRDEWLQVVALLQIPKEAGPFDPTVAVNEINELGMVADTAAVQAIRWFERSLELGPDVEGRAAILSHLDTLYRRFPHLRR